MWSVSADPARFDEAVEWFRGRVPLTDELFELLGAAFQRRAFRVAGVAQLQIVNEVYQILLDLLNAGGSLGDFKRQVRQRLTSQFVASRVETIFRNNVQSAFNAGRWRQLQQPAVRRHRPYLMYDAAMDSRTSEMCRDRNGKVLHRSDPWWSSNQPPLHHRCRSAVRALTTKQAQRRGIVTGPELTDLPPVTEGFGAEPSEDDWRPDPTNYPPELWANFADKQELLNAEES